MYLSDFLIGNSQTSVILNNFPITIELASDHLRTILGYNEEKLLMTNMDDTYEILLQISILFSLLTDLLCRISFQKEKYEVFSSYHGKVKPQTLNDKIKAFAWSKLFSIDLIKLVIDVMSFLDKKFPIRCLRIIFKTC
jgi:hypothetical protein